MKYIIKFFLILSVFMFAITSYASPELAVKKEWLPPYIKDAQQIDSAIGKISVPTNKHRIGAYAFMITPDTHSLWLAYQDLDDNGLIVIKAYIKGKWVDDTLSTYMYIKPEQTNTRLTITSENKDYFIINSINKTNGEVLSTMHFERDRLEKNY